MTPKDFIYQQVFKDLMSKGLNQKLAGDQAARAVYLFAHGRAYKDAVKQVTDECKSQIKAAKGRSK